MAWGSTSALGTTAQHPTIPFPRAHLLVPAWLRLFAKAGARGTVISINGLDPRDLDLIGSPTMAATKGAPACTANAQSVMATTTSGPTPDGPCQCYPGCDYGPQHDVGIGATSCAQVGNACVQYIQQFISCHNGVCTQGSPCNTNSWWTNCRYITCNGTPCGYEVDCFAVWGCYYCD